MKPLYNQKWRVNSQLPVELKWQEDFLESDKCWQEGEVKHIYIFFLKKKEINKKKRLQKKVTTDRF